MPWIEVHSTEGSQQTSLAREESNLCQGPRRSAFRCPLDPLKALFKLQNQPHLVVISGISSRNRHVSVLAIHEHGRVRFRGAQPLNKLITTGLFEREVRLQHADLFCNR